MLPQLNRLSTDAAATKAKPPTDDPGTPIDAPVTPMSGNAPITPVDAPTEMPITRVEAPTETPINHTCYQCTGSQKAIGEEY